MGLLSNGYRHTLTGRLFGATALDGANPSVLRSLPKPAYQRNILAGEAITSDLVSVPDGQRHPNVWIMARKSGGMSSINNTEFTLTGTASILAGYPISGNTTITISIDDATGQAVASGIGTATVTITANNLTLTSSVSGSGTATLEINGATSTLGAVASVIGDATIVITGDLDLNAWGLMEGSTVDNSVLTNDSITQAVWSALAADNNLNNTMGELLNNAAAGGVNVNALANAIVNALKLDPSTLTVSKFLGLK